MAKTISEKTEPKRFRSKNFVHSYTRDSHELITITGIVRVDFMGDFHGQGKWIRDKLTLEIIFPDLIDAGKVFRIEQQAPFATINSIYNLNYAVNAGWAVDEFGGPTLPAFIQKGSTYDLEMDVAVRDDGWLYRVGYSVTVIGALMDMDPRS